MMEWTTEKPTKPGWYWFRSDGVKLFVVEVYFNTGSDLCVIVGTYDLYMSEVEDYEQFEDSEWSSEPIPEPKEKA